MIQQMTIVIYMEQDQIFYIILYQRMKLSLAFIKKIKKIKMMI